MFPFVGLDSLCAPFLSLHFNDEGKNEKKRYLVKVTTFFAYFKVRENNFFFLYSSRIRLLSGFYSQVPAQLLLEGQFGHHSRSVLRKFCVCGSFVSISFRNFLPIINSWGHVVSFDGILVHIKFKVKLLCYSRFFSCLFFFRISSSFFSVDCISWSWTV